MREQNRRSGERARSALEAAGEGFDRSLQTTGVLWLELAVFGSTFADEGADLTPVVSTTMAHPTYAADTDHEN